MTDLAPIFAALSDPTRLAVFECIRGCGGQAKYDEQTGECDGGQPDAICSCDVRCVVPCAPSTLTHHLNILRAAGLIETEKQGREVFARVKPAGLEPIRDFLNPTGCCQPQLTTIS